MRKILMKIAAFMEGRYMRFDALNILLLALYLITNVVTSFMRPRYGAAYWIFLSVGAICALYMIFRFFSKNTWAREKENRGFSKFFRALKDKWTLGVKRIKHFKTSVFRHCPHCKAILKLPHKKGRHTVRCPKCNEKFSVRIIL